MTLLLTALQDREILELRAHAPSLLSTLISRLDTLYHQRIETGQGDVVLRMIPPLIKTAQDLLATFEAINAMDNSEGQVRVD